MKHTALIKVDLKNKISLPEKNKNIFEILREKIFPKNEYKEYFFELDRLIYVLEKIRIIYSTMGISDIVRISGDAVDFYVDMHEKDNDFKNRLSAFNSELQSSFEKLHDKITLILQKKTNDLDYTIENIIVTRTLDYSIIIRLTALVKQVSEDEKVKKEFELFVYKLEKNIKKFINANEVFLKIDLPEIQEKEQDKNEKQLLEKKEEPQRDIPKSAVGHLKNGYSNEFFPLYGVTLGITTENELKKKGVRAKYRDNSGQKYKYYSINNTNFWYDNGIAERMYITHTDAMPEKWQKIGFDWNSSYSEWLKLMEKLDFFVSIVRKPQTVWYDKHRSFSAEFSASKKITENFELTFRFSFNYSRGRKVDSKDTLYNISINIA